MPPNTEMVKDIHSTTSHSVSMYGRLHNTMPEKNVPSSNTYSKNGTVPVRKHRGVDHSEIW